MAFIIVTGIPGVGKTTALKMFLEKNVKYKWVDFGELFEESAKRLKLVSARDEIRNLEHSVYRKIQLECAKKLSKIKGDVIVTTHLSLRSQRGYFPGLPLDVLSLLKPEFIIVIESDPKDIIKQQSGDKERMRSDFGGEKEIKEYQEINRYYAVAYSAISGCHLAFVMGAYHKSEITAKKIEEVLR